jgi:hypothetical protein
VNGVLIARVGRQNERFGAVPGRARAAPEGSSFTNGQRVGAPNGDAQIRREFSARPA